MAELPTTRPTVLLEAANGATLAVQARGGSGEAALRLGEAIGLPVPTSLGASFADGRACVCVGSESWLVLDETGALDEEALADALGSSAAVFDQSSGLRVFALIGPDAAGLLQAAVPLDLDARALPLGAAASTLLAHIAVTFWRKEADAFRLAVARSYGGAFVEALALIARGRGVRLSMEDGENAGQR